MNLSLSKAVGCFGLALLLLGIAGVAFGLNYYPTSYHWGFQNYSYLGFDREMNFIEAPNQGVLYDGSLVGSWNMNEGSGTIAYDSSANGNNGAITGTSWVDGKYGKALSFNGITDYVNCGNDSSLDVTSSFTIMAWVRINNISSEQEIVSKQYSAYELKIYSGRFAFECFVGGVDVWAKANNVVPVPGQWYFVAWTYDSTTHHLYINGMNQVLTFGAGSGVAGPINTTTFNLYFGRRASGGLAYDGIIDEVRIYNRTLSASEVTAFYAIGPYAQPDPVSFVNYYNFTDPITDNTMLIHVDSPTANSNNVALVTCTNFFSDNRLIFQANKSATVNVWTNIGQPSFTTGVWNSQNYTTTLNFNDKSVQEMNWNTYKITTYTDAASSVSPSNVTVGYRGSQTFNFSATKGYRFNATVDNGPQGQISSYTFNNVTASHIINVTSQPTYTITALAGPNGSITPSGSVVVGYGEAQQFNFTANTGYHVSNVLVDNVFLGALQNYTFSNVSANHIISVSFDINASSTFPTETVLLAVAAIAILIGAFALAFKKGYIKIEIIDESTEEKPEDYSI